MNIKYQWWIFEQTTPVPVQDVNGTILEAYGFGS